MTETGWADRQIAPWPTEANDPWGEEIRATEQKDVDVRVHVRGFSDQPTMLTSRYLSDIVWPFEESVHRFSNVDAFRARKASVLTNQGFDELILFSGEADLCEAGTSVEKQITGVRKRSSHSSGKRFWRVSEEATDLPISADLAVSDPLGLEVCAWVKEYGPAPIQDFVEQFVDRENFGRVFARCILAGLVRMKDRSLILSQRGRDTLRDYGIGE